MEGEKLFMEATLFFMAFLTMGSRRLGRAKRRISEEKISFGQKKGKKEIQ